MYTPRTPVEAIPNASYYTTRLSKIAILVIHMTDRALWLGH